MNLLALTAITVGRALLVVLVAMAISGPLRRWLSAQEDRHRPWIWALLLAPFLTPPSLPGYAFSRWGFSTGNEILYFSVLTLKLLPVAVILQFCRPAPLSPEARHLHRSLPGRRRQDHWRFLAQGAGAGTWTSAGLVFLLAFTDFGLASLWKIPTWTIAIGNNGTARGLAAVSFLAAVAVVIDFILRRRRLGSAAPSNHSPGSRWPWWYLGMAVGLVCFVPLAIVLVFASTDLSAVGQASILAPRIGMSVLLAGGAVLLADVSALRPIVSPALHIARQSGDPRLLWTLEGRPRWMARAAVFCGAYFAMASVLAISERPATILAIFVAPALILGAATVGGRRARSRQGIHG